MSALDLKIPPPIVTLVLALLMWLTPAVAGHLEISYVGLLLTLLAFAVFLANPLAVLWVVVYVLYITQFQIIPEERVLASLFGAEYETYKGRVRRWI
jgi:hypothetical protein